MPIPDNYTMPAYLSAKERAFKQIQEWIIDGTLQPKEKLNDIDLAKAIGVSRTPVREALQMLNFQGFVTMKPGVATLVSDINADDIVKILPPLAALQSLAAELATSVIDEENMIVLRRINENFEQELENDNFYAALKYDEQFHAKIVGICRNEYIESAVSMFQAHVRRLFFQKSIILTKDSVKEHKALIAAFEQKDKDEASRIARENWYRPIDLYYSML